jgi:mRNA-degrading endonuclease RelE of RelBE toxin-antitoxin system
MEILLHPKFKKEYRKLPKHIKMLAEEKISIFRKNAFDVRLKTHRLHGKLRYLHAFYIDRKKYRIEFEILEDDIVRLYHIGTHDIYK